MSYNPYTNNKKDSENQFAFGFILALFFSIIGLFAGLLFPEESKKRLTFIDGWKNGIIWGIVLMVIIGLIIALII